MTGYLREIAIDEPRLVGVSDLLLDARLGGADGERRRVLDELAVRDAYLLLDLASGLVEQPRLLGGGQLPDTLLLTFDFGTAARLERIDFGGEGLELRVELGDQRGRAGLHSLGRVEVGADLGLAGRQVARERRAQVVDEHAGEHRKVEDLADERPDAL